MAKNIRTMLLAGMVVSCVLIGIISFTSWYAFEQQQERTEHLLSETETKTGLIYDMRIAARERNLRLMMSLLLEDEFLIDEQQMAFREQGSRFLNARETYIEMGLSPYEKQLLDEQRKLSITAVAIQYQIQNHAIEGNKEQALELISEELSHQGEVFDVLDRLLELQKSKNREFIEQARIAQGKAARAVWVLSGLVVSIIILMTAYINRRLYQQATHIENEGLKFKALIEGSMDAVLVLDQHEVIDCNVNALRMFAVSSLSELNVIGLDYLSRFSDSKGQGNSQEIFSAVNHALVNVKRRYQWEYIDAYGKSFPTDVELTGIDIDGSHYVQMVIRDVTERENFQNALRKANENLEQKVLERTEELNDLNTKMVGMARSAGMAEVASGVLHNVGNVLNSVNVSTSMLKAQVKNCKSANLDKLLVLLKENENNLADFFENNEKGKYIIPYLEQLVSQLGEEQEKQMEELDGLSDNVDHIKNIISMQQSYTGNMGMVERLVASEVFEDAVKINVASIGKHDIKIKYDYEYDPELAVDKHKLIQILVNLISNAKYAVINGGNDDKKITVGIRSHFGEVEFYVQDNGIGIEKSDLDHIFEFGFKKREGGHGFGLHHSALMAKELEGVLTAESEGLGKGSTFTLRIPLDV